MASRQGNFAVQNRTRTLSANELRGSKPDAHFGRKHNKWTNSGGLGEAKEPAAGRAKRRSAQRLQWRAMAGRLLVAKLFIRDRPHKLRQEKTFLELTLICISG
jgi:hypothetical protein